MPFVLIRCDHYVHPFFNRLLMWILLISGVMWYRGETPWTYLSATPPVTAQQQQQQQQLSFPGAAPAPAGMVNIGPAPGAVPTPMLVPSKAAPAPAPARKAAPTAVAPPPAPLPPILKQQQPPALKQQPTAPAPAPKAPGPGWGQRHVPYVIDIGAGMFLYKGLGKNDGVVIRSGHFFHRIQNCSVENQDCSVQNHVLFRQTFRALS